MNFRKQFDVEIVYEKDELSGKLKCKTFPEFDDPQYKPIKSFLPGQSESLERLVQRMQAGQMVLTFEDGVTFEDQVFDTQMVDKFDVLDKADMLDESVRAQRRKAAAEKKTVVSPSQESDPPTP